MIRKEDIERIRQIIAHEDSISRRTLRALEENDRRLEISRRKWKKEDDLKQTGVVAFFEALRDGGVVRWSDEPLYETREISGFLRKRKVQVKVGDHQPAKIEINENGVTLTFNHVDWNANSYREDSIVAYLERDFLAILHDGSGGQAVPLVDGVADRQKMVEAVGKAIIRPICKNVYNGVIRHDL